MEIKCFLFSPNTSEEVLAQGDKRELEIAVTTYVHALYDPWPPNWTTDSAIELLVAPKKTAMYLASINASLYGEVNLVVVTVLFQPTVWVTLTALDEWAQYSVQWSCGVL